MHAHVIPSDWNAALELHAAHGWPVLTEVDECTAYLACADKPGLRVPYGAWSAEKRIADMDLAGIDVQLLSPIPTVLGYDQDPAEARLVARHHNEHVASLVAAFPTRFSGVAMVPLQDIAAAVTEVHHAGACLGLRAVEIGTNINGVELDDDKLAPFYSACAELDMSIFVHPAGCQIGIERMNAYYLPNTVGNPLETAFAAVRLILGGVLERWPTLRVCFSHGGGALSTIIGRVERAWTTREDTRAKSTRPPSEMARLLYFDSITHDDALLTHLVERLGWRVVMGSDYPFVYLGEPDPIGFFERAGFDRKAIGHITDTEAANFLAWAR